MASVLADVSTCVRIQVAARKDLYRTLNGNGWDRVDSVLDTVVKGVMGVKVQNPAP